VPPKKFKPKRDQTAAQKRANALKRLRQMWEDDHENETWEPENEPVITPMLRSVDGGISRVIEALRSHENDEARLFLDVYDQLPAADRGRVSIEEIAFAAGVGALRLAEVTQTALFLSGQMKVNMLLSSHLPAVVARSLTEAKKAKGLADREWMLKAGKILPVPKGAQITFNNQNVGQGGEEDKEPESKPLWLDAGQRLREIHDLTDQRRLPAPASEPIHIGGGLDSMQSQTAEMVHVLTEKGD
jgi:hypothetical protein